MSTRESVVSVLKQIAADQGRTLAPLSDDLLLIESGLDSLSFAIAVARLEDMLGIDPFDSSDSIDFPVTLADFVRLYERANA